MNPESSWTPPDVAELSTDFTSLEISHLLARGGMSAVYLARQVSLDREVVLKILPKEVALNAGDVARLKREAKLLAKLRDPGIVEIYDAGISSGGYPYLLLEYEEGGDLRHWAHARAVTPEEAMGIGQSLTAALAAAHGEGVLHGDIKPDNVFLDAKGRLKLGDFGLADFTGAASAAYHTPGYTAPEILAGERHITVQTDLYAVAATVFELVCGAPPPEDEARRAALLESLPGAAKHAIMAGLAAHPGQRPGSASDYREIFRMAALPGRPAGTAGTGIPGAAVRRPVARPAAGRGPGAIPKRRRSGLLPAIGAAALVAAGAVFFLTRTGSDPQPTNAVADTEPPESTPEAPAIAAAPSSPSPSAGGSSSGPGAESFTNWLEGEGKPPAPAENPPEVDRHPLTLEELNQWSPGWIIDAPNGAHRDAARLSVSGTKAEGNPVLMLVPFSPSKPYTISRRTELPGDLAQELRVRVAANTPEGADWVLRAFVDDQPLGKPEVISRTAEEKDRFREVAWSLELWRGRTVTLRLEGADGGAHSWHWEQGFWSWIKLQPLKATEKTLASGGTGGEMPSLPIPPASGAFTAPELPAGSEKTLQSLAGFAQNKKAEYYKAVAAGRKSLAGIMRQNAPLAQRDQYLQEVNRIEKLEPGNDLVDEDVKAAVLEPNTHWLYRDWKHPERGTVVTFLPNGKGTGNGEPMQWRLLDERNLLVVHSPVDSDRWLDLGMFAGQEGRIVNISGDLLRRVPAGTSDVVRRLASKQIAKQIREEEELRQEVDRAILEKRDAVITYLEQQNAGAPAELRERLRAKATEAAMPVRVHVAQPEDRAHPSGEWILCGYRVTFAPGGELLGRNAREPKWPLGRWLWAHPERRTALAFCFGKGKAFTAGLARFSNTEQGVMRVFMLTGDSSRDAQRLGDIDKVPVITYVDQTASSTGSSPDPIIGRWKWNGWGGTVSEVEFLPDGSAKNPGARGGGGSWKRLEPATDRKYEVRWTNSAVVTGTLSADGNSFSGVRPQDNVKVSADRIGQTPPR